MKETVFPRFIQPFFHKNRFFNTKIGSEVTKNMTTSWLSVWQSLLLLCFLSVHSIDGFLPVGRHTSPICKLRSSVKDVPRTVQPSLEIPENEVDTVYDHFVLPNDIPVILVSDPTSEKASGSLAVATGAANDPIDRSGLAHFTEHAVFLGSEKYPQTVSIQEWWII